jgi:CysZ protein
MSKVLSTFSSTLDIFKKDKIILMFGFIPISIGLILYAFFGNWIITDIMIKIKNWIEGFISNDLGSILYYIIFFSISLIFLFIVNWTFVLVVSIISSPFNDIISERVESFKNKSDLEGLPQNLKKIFKNLLKNTMNEIKKVLLIFSLTMIILFVDIFIPFLAPLGLLLSALLLSSSFLDYSWSRHNTPFKNCVRELKNYFFIYSFSGAVFMFLFALPVINLFALPFGIVYYTLLFCEQKDQKKVNDPNC